MRVIAGSARRLRLKTIEGLDTRPTTDRIKETLFNIFGNDVTDCFFLDLFSGSGGIGIEALSRGAKLAVMIDNNPEAAACIRDNLSSTKLEDSGIVMSSDVISGLKRLEERKMAFDIIFMDPPYNHLHEKAVLEALSHSSLVKDETLIVVEASKETEFDYIPSLGFRIERCKEYKTNRHLFITKGEN